MSGLPQSGILVVAGQTIEVKYTLETAKRQYTAIETVLGRLRSPLLPSALPKGTIASATLRLQGGMEISVALTDRVKDSAAFRVLGKPTA